MNREQWLTERLGGIGASESAAILGYDPYQSPWSIWQKKVDQVIEDVDSGPMAEWGHRHESAIAQKFSEEHPEFEIQDPGDYYIEWATGLSVPMFCTPDRILYHGSEKSVLELKCAWYDRAKEFEDDLPIHYRIQVTHQMLCLGIEHAYYAVLLNGYDFRWYREELNEKFAQALVKKLTEFWELVQSKTAPATDWRNGTKQAIVAHYGVADVTIELPERMATVDSERERLKSQRADIDRKIKAYDNEIRAALGEATTGVLPDGQTALTWAPRKDGVRILGRKTLQREAC